MRWGDKTGEKGGGYKKRERRCGRGKREGYLSDGERKVRKRED